MSGVGTLKYYDAEEEIFKRAKSARYWDALNSKWEHVRGDGSVTKGGFKYYDVSDSKWWTVEVRQPMPLNQPSFYHTAILWHFDEMTGDIVEDYSGHDNDLRLNRYAQQPQWVEGYFYGALHFTNDRLFADGGDYHNYRDDQNWQIDVIFKLLGSAPGENKVFLSDYCYSDSTQLWVGTQGGTGRLAMTVRDKSGNTDFLTGVTNVYDNEWHKASFCRENGVISIHLDGNQQNSKNDNNSAGYTVQGWQVGWTSLGVFPQYSLNNCYIDEIRVMEGILVTEL